MLKVENGANIIPQQRSKVSKTVFKYMNTYYMVPLSRWGLLPWILNPLSGYIMVLQTIGRASGKPRLTPLNYALADGCIYCIAGFGSGTNWLANLKANPNVEVHLAGTAVKGRAEIVTEREEAERIKARAAITALQLVDVPPPSARGCLQPTGSHVPLRPAPASPSRGGASRLVAAHPAP